MKHEQQLPSSGFAGPVLVCGFAAAIAVWCAWFITHLPWMGMAEQTALPLLGGIWVAAIAFGVSRVPKSQSLVAGTLAGLLCALLGLFALGSKLAEPPNASGVSAGLKPAAAMIAAGFLAFGAVLGILGGVIGMMLSRNPAPITHDRWLARFALVACVAITPLLFVGGLVTSTSSGMAVPDWPNTFGSNMFLYPLGPRSEPGLYLEHAHRLFGTLVGVTAFTLMILSFLWQRRTSIRVVASIAFGLVCVQGILGGLRVQQNSPGMAMVHGVLAQLVFGLVVAIAVILSDAFRTYGSGAVVEPAPARKTKFLSAALMHSLILQLLFGAAYRHLHEVHALWTHMAFSIIVVVFGLAAGFTLTSQNIRSSSPGRLLSTVGKGIVAVVTIQFVLGWATLMAGGKAQEAVSVTQALIRTAHQANGAVLLALAVTAFLWGRRLNAKNAAVA